MNLNCFGAADLVNQNLRAPSSANSGGNGVYRYGSGFPNQTFNANNYWVDVTFKLQ